MNTPPVIEKNTNFLVNWNEVIRIKDTENWQMLTLKLWPPHRNPVKLEIFCVPEWQGYHVSQTGKCNPLWNNDCESRSE